VGMKYSLEQMMRDKCYKTKTYKLVQPCSYHNQCKFITLTFSFLIYILLFHLTEN